MNTRLLPFALALLAALPGFALAHPHHAGTYAAPASHDHAVHGAPTLEALDHLHSFLARSVYPRTTPRQHESLLMAERIYGLLHAWRPSPATDDEIAALHTEAVRFYEEIHGDWPLVEATWDGTTWSLALPDEPVALARGLARDVLVEARNESSAEIRLTIPGSLAPETRVPPGEMRPLLLELRADDLAMQAAALAVAGSAPLAIPLPVRVQEPAVLRGRALDGQTGEPLPARLTFIGADGIIRHASAYAHNKTLSEKSIPFRPLMVHLPFCYVPGEYEVLLPPGPARVTIERGFESAIVARDIVLEAGKEATLDIETSRAVDMKALGWISGDTHIHWVENTWDVNEDLGLLAVVQRAEDLRVANNLTLYQWRDDAMGGPFTKPDQHPMGPVAEHCDDQYHIQMAEEFRNDNHHGHINLLDITELITPVATGPGSGGPEGTIDWPMNKWVIEQARAQGGISVEAHDLGPFHSSGVAVNVIMGHSDALDQLTPAHYYRFLDCGVRIGLGNGSDHPARVAGVCRVYVKSGPALDYSRWCDELAAGKSFTTSGPLLFLEVDGIGPGETIDARPGQEVHVTARAWSRRPIGNLQVVTNGGRVVAQLNTGRTEAEVSFRHVVDGPAWFTARCAPGEDHNALDGRDIAHTSAAYVRVGGRDSLDPEAAQWFAGNVRAHRERLLATANFESDEQKAQTLAWIDAGLARYEAIAGGRPLKELDDEAGRLARGM